MNMYKEEYIKKCEDLINKIKLSETSAQYDKLIENISNEPNYDLFIHNNLPCLILRHSDFGHLCGYVGVPKNSDLYGVDYDNIYDFDHRNIISVHCGVTYTDTMGNLVPNYKDYWFIGFDCAHSGDFSPYYLLGAYRFMFISGSTNTYKDYNFVVKETKNLTEQLIKVDPSLKTLIRKNKIKKILNNG